MKLHLPKTAEIQNDDALPFKRCKFIRERHQIAPHRLDRGRVDEVRLHEKKAVALGLQTLEKIARFAFLRRMPGGD